MCSVCGGRRAAVASPIRCVGERITATGVPEFREVAWRACLQSPRLARSNLAQQTKFISSMPVKQVPNQAA
ncbi:hypothetical protein [Bathymodiolus japonicus methanotrophic gill symbiont]|uniref:hypothetical protein n=1 Tax=Bathymodiolus japonicus methanotrophic gill symbiont TaxID=113269 RepID=UPI001C8D5981|nr:hypothetical protein [Bathymodiolus japonicus methanotrophic gill symbiont]